MSCLKSPLDRKSQTLLTGLEHTTPVKTVICSFTHCSLSTSPYTHTQSKTYIHCIISKLLVVSKVRLWTLSFLTSFCPSFFLSFLPCFFSFLLFVGFSIHGETSCVLQFHSHQFCCCLSVPKRLWSFSIVSFWFFSFFFSLEIEKKSNIIFLSTLYSVLVWLMK